MDFFYRVIDCVCVYVWVAFFFSHFAGWDVQGGMLGIFCFLENIEQTIKTYPKGSRYVLRIRDFPQNRPQIILFWGLGIETINPTPDRALES